MSKILSSQELRKLAPKGNWLILQLWNTASVLEKKLYKVGENSWSLIGNGLSNQSFVEGPEGLICIDTGESNQEMAAALKEVRKETQAPVVACIYTHFHYVGGTQTLFDENNKLAIWGHDGIQANLDRFGGEVAPRVTRGLAHQFATSMPQEGPDGIVNLGLEIFSVTLSMLLSPMVTFHQNIHLLSQLKQKLPD